MDELARLREAAFKTELGMARRAAAGSGIGELEALRRVLEQSAGATGLAALLAERAAVRARAAASRAARRAAQAQSAAVRAARHDGEATPWRGWFDGSAHPNPGRCGIGALLRGPDGAQVAISRAAGYGNSSEAEYRALIALLEAALQAGARGLTVYGDSQVVIDDVNGSDERAAASLRPLRDAARILLAQLGEVALRWIPRHKNPEADALSQQAVAWQDGRDALR